MMNEQIPLDRPSAYMEFLPAIYRQGEINGKANDFLGRFLKVFEKILSGIDDGVHLQQQTPDGQPLEREIIGIEQVLDKIHDYFDPLFTPPIVEGEAGNLEFVEYLAGWVALVMNQNWPESRKRRILKRIVPLYKKRGTKEGLSEYLRIFVGPNVQIEEQLQGLQVGGQSTVGIDTIIGGAPPYFFFVRITLLEQDLKPEKISPKIFGDLIHLTREIIDTEKPAHTYYAIRYDVPGIIVGKLSHVGANTLIGLRSIPRFIL
jgi:phage tail-like protein